MTQLKLITEHLRQLPAFEYLTEQQLVIVAGQTELLRFEPEEVLFDINDRDTQDYFLIGGSLELTASDGKGYRLLAGSEDALRPISTLRPRKYQAMVHSKAKLLSLPHQLLTYVLQKHNELEQQDTLVEFTRGQMSPQMVASEIRQSILHGELTLPSLPDVAVKIRQFASEREHTMEQLAQVVMLDPAISAKLIQSANSPLYRGVAMVESVLDAVIRLGKDTTVQLVNLFAIREVFNSEQPELSERFLKIWRDSIDVAVICAVLARKSQLAFKPEVAMLAGLLHRIGEVAIISFAADYRGLLSSQEEVQQVVQQLVADFKSPVACDIIEHWQLGDVYYQCMKYLEHWFKETVMEPDYPDLLNVALLHEYIHNHQYHNLPRIDQLPAFQRIKVGPSTPEFSIKVLEESQEELRVLKRLLIG